MSTSNRIELIHGSQSFKRSSLKVSTFAMNADNTAGRKFPSKVLDQTFYQGILASRQGYAENGMWYRASYESLEGTILMLQVSKTYHGSPLADGCMLIALRDTAPLYNIYAIPQFNADATYKDRVLIFSGRADILGLQDFADRGVVFRERFIDNKFNEEELEELFSYRLLSEGSAIPETLKVTKADGSIRTVSVSAKPARKIRVRRR